MANLKVHHYERRFSQLVNEYNRIFPGPFYFSRLIKAKEVTIADLGSGPVCTLGTLWAGVKIKIYASDIKQPQYSKLWEKNGVTPLIPIEYQDMEKLTYKNESFDIVHCVNALDHTYNPEKALNEMKRICKTGGYVYLRHIRDQKAVNSGRGHYWNASKKGFSNGTTTISLDDFITTDDGYFVVSLWRKT